MTRAAGERQVYTDAAAASVPPGERAEDELTGSESIEALSDALLDVTGEARVKFANVKNIEVRKVGRWVIVTVKSNGDPNELTFRVSRAWAKVMKNRLISALAK